MTADKKNIAEVKMNSFLGSIEKLTLRTSTCRKAKNGGMKLHALLDRINPDLFEIYMEAKNKALG